MVDSPCLRLAHGQEGHVVRVVGKGTLRESPAFRHVVQRSLQQTSQIIVDLSDCGYLDSTFLGCMIGLHKQFNESGTDRFLIAADRPSRLRLFSASNLHKLLMFVDHYPKLVSESVAVEVIHVDARELGLHVMHCHQRLADLGGKDAESFSSVAEDLRRELEG